MLRRTLRTALLVFAALAVVLSIALAVLLSTDLGRFRGQIEGLASAALGRELSVEDLSLRVGRTIRVSAAGLAIANPEWAAEASMLRVGSLDVVLDARSVLSGPLRFQSVRLSDVVFNVEQDEGGRSNLSFGGGQTEETPERRDDESEPPLLFEDITARDITIVVRHPELTDQMDVRIDALDHHVSEGRLLSQLSGSVNDIALALSNDLGPRESLRAGREVTFELEGHLGEVTLAGSGRIDNVFDPRRPSLDVSVTGPDVEYLIEVLELPALTSGPLDLRIGVSTSAARVELAAHGVVGEFRIDVEGHAAGLDRLLDGELDFDASGPDLGRVGRLGGVKGLPGEPFDVSGRLLRREGGLVLEDVRLAVGPSHLRVDGSLPRFPDPGGARVELSVAGDDVSRFRELLGLPQLAAGPFELRAGLEEDAAGATLVNLDGRVGDLTKRVSARLGAYPDFAGTHLTFELAAPDLGVVGASAGARGLPAVPFSTSGEAVYRGDTIELLASQTTVGELELSLEGTVPIASAGTGTELSFDVSTGDLEAVAASAGVDAGVPALPLRATGRLERRADRTRLRELRFRLGESSGSLSGTVGDPPAFARTSIDVAFEGPSLAALLADSGPGELPDEAFRISAQVALADAEIRVEDIEVRLGGGALAGTLAVQRERSLASGRFDLRATARDLSRIVPASPAYAPPAVPFQADARGRWSGDRWDLSSLSLTFSESRLSIAGVVDGPPGLDGTDVTFEARGPSLLHLGTLRDFEAADLPFELSGRFTGSGETLAGRGISVTVGDSDAELELSVREGEVPAVDLVLRAGLVDLTPFQREPASNEEAAPPDADGDGRLIPDSPLPLAWMARLDAAADVQVGELRLRQGPVRDLKLRASLEDETLLVSELSGVGRRGDLHATLRIDPTENGARTVALDVGATQISLAGLQASAETVQARPAFDVTIDLDGEGATFRQLAASLDGRVRVRGGSGVFPSQSGPFARLFVRDFTSELVSTVNPLAKKDPNVTVSCVAVILDVRDGVVRGDPALVLQTRELNIFGNAVVDLATEDLDADFRTSVRKGLGISLSDFAQPFTRVSGTLASPTIVISGKEALVEGGAAVATGGLSFLAKKFRDRFLTAKDPCGAALAAAD